MPTIAGMLRARAGDDRTGLTFEDERFRYRDLVQEAADRASFLLADADAGPQHVGLLLDNVPEYLHWLSAAALSGGVLVGINPTRRGPELGADIRHTDCRWIVTDRAHLPLLDGVDTGVPDHRLLVVDDPSWPGRLAPHRGAALPATTPAEDDLLLLIFTSGTSGGAPKACRCTQGRLARLGEYMRGRTELTDADVCYQAMPLFHSNALMGCWAPALSAGAAVAMRRRFSASQWLPDVRRSGATYFNYVGRPLAYILATPERADDADNRLRLAYGSEGNRRDVEEFARRFGCEVVDSYGSTEGVIAIPSTPDTPAAALGRLPDGVRVRDRDTGRPVATARFDGAGRLVNADEAIGELVGDTGSRAFEGYYGDARGGIADAEYWSGDLGYVDADGFVYFAGRTHDRIRVDGENLAAGPVADIVARHPDVALAAVYAVPDERVGDQVMACVQLRDGAGFDPAGFDVFLDAQPDLGTKGRPRYVRVTASMPLTESNKIITRRLRDELWECADPVWWRSRNGEPLTRLDDDGRRRLRAAMAASGTDAALPVTR